MANLGGEFGGYAMARCRSYMMLGATKAELRPYTILFSLRLSPTNIYLEIRWEILLVAIVFRMFANLCILKYCTYAIQDITRDLIFRYWMHCERIFPELYIILGYSYSARIHFDSHPNDALKHLIESDWCCWNVRVII